MSDANQDYFDSAIRHQIGIRRFASGEVRAILAILELADAELARLLRERLARLGSEQPIDFTSQRWNQLLSDIRFARQAALDRVEGRLAQDLSQLGPMEAQFEERMIRAAVPIEIGFASVNPDQLRAIATMRPFQGKLLGQWFDGLAQADQNRLIQALQLGMTNGETIPQIMRRIIGTKANGYTDGILTATRREAEAIARTAVNHVSNTARESVWEANGDIISYKRWTSTLDGRTSAICRARDGKGVRVGEKPLPQGIDEVEPKGARPPAHVNCRSVLVAVLDGMGLLGDRPYVTDTRRREQREADFRAEAKRTGKTIQEVRRDWANRNVGQTPAATTYEEFLRRQSAEFQDDVLGKTKGKLYRQGGLRVDQFVDRQGNELSLQQLAETHPEAFRRAGI